MNIILEKIVNFFISKEPPFLLDGSLNPNYVNFEKLNSIATNGEHQVYTQNLPPVTKEESKNFNDLQKMDAQIDSIGSSKEKIILSIQKAKEKAKYFIKIKNIKLAKKWIEHSKKLEAQIEQNENKETNLTLMRSKLESVQMDQNIFDVQRQAVSTMSEIFKKTGTIDEISDAQEDVKELFEESERFTKSISEPLLQFSEMVNEDQAELEFQAFVKECEEEEENNNNNDNGNMMMKTVSVPPTNTTINSVVSDKDIEEMVEISINLETVQIPKKPLTQSTSEKNDHPVMMKF
jgi:hypothetical protein